MVRHLLAVGAFAFGNTSVIIRRTAALMRRVRVLHSFRDHNFTAGQYRCEDRTASNERCMIRHLIAVGAFAFGNTSVIRRRTAALMRRVRVLHSFRDHNFTADQ
jgi:hypothetical protein